MDHNHNKYRQTSFMERRAYLMFLKDTVGFRDMKPFKLMLMEHIQSPNEIFNTELHKLIAARFATTRQHSSVPHSEIKLDLPMLAAMFPQIESNYITKLLNMFSDMPHYHEIVLRLLIDKQMNRNSEKPSGGQTGQKRQHTEETAFNGNGEETEMGSSSPKMLKLNDNDTVQYNVEQETDAYNNKKHPGYLENIYTTSHYVHYHDSTVMMISKDLPQTEKKSSSLPLTSNRDSHIIVLEKRPIQGAQTTVEPSFDEPQEAVLQIAGPSSSGTTITNAAAPTSAVNEISTSTAASAAAFGNMDGAGGKKSVLKNVASTSAARTATLNLEHFDNFSRVLRSSKVKYLGEISSDAGGTSNSNKTSNYLGNKNDVETVREISGTNNSGATNNNGHLANGGTGGAREDPNSLEPVANNDGDEWSMLLDYIQEDSTQRDSSNNIDLTADAGSGRPYSTVGMGPTIDLTNTLSKIKRLKPKIIQLKTPTIDMVSPPHIFSNRTESPLSEPTTAGLLPAVPQYERRVPPLILKLKPTEQLIEQRPAPVVPLTLAPATTAPAVKEIDRIVSVGSGAQAEATTSVVATGMPTSVTAPSVGTTDKLVKNRKDVKVSISLADTAQAEAPTTATTTTAAAVSALMAAAVAEPAKKKEGILDRRLVNRLCEIFPDAAPDYIRDLCQNKLMDDATLGYLSSRILEAGDNYPKRALPQPTEEPENISSEEQFRILQDFLPDADPDYLRMMCDKHANNKDSLKQFLDEAIDKRDYPKLRDYQRRQQLSAQQRQYMSEFSVEKFVKLIPDPIAFFSDKSRQVKMDDRSCHYALVFLRNVFDKMAVSTIQSTFQKNDRNVFKTFNALKKITDQRHYIKARRKPMKLPDNIDNIPLLQEVAYFAHEHEINVYLEHLKQEEQKEIDEAKANGSMKTCCCCFDDEILPKNAFTCANGCISCRDCIVRSTQVLFGEGNLDFPCLSACSEHFSLQTLQAALPSKLFSKLAQKKAIAEVKAAGIEELEVCPFCEFATIPPEGDKIFSCLNPDCMKQSCRECKEPSHLPLRCDEVEKDENVKARILLEDEMTEGLLRKCYKCGVKFFKEDGCNKMTCARCGATMCYICKQPVTNYKHFNGQGGDRHDLCPLYSDTNKFNKENVLAAAKKAKATIDKSKLKIDPTQDIEKHYAKPSTSGGIQGIAANFPFHIVLPGEDHHQLQQARARHNPPPRRDVAEYWFDPQ